jgi:hypothetical protein
MVKCRSLSSFQTNVNIFKKSSTPTSRENLLCKLSTHGFVCCAPLSPSSLGSAGTRCMYHNLDTVAANCQHSFLLYREILRMKVSNAHLPAKVLYESTIVAWMVDFLPLTVPSLWIFRVEPISLIMALSSEGKGCWRLRVIILLVGRKVEVHTIGGMAN